MNPILIMLLLFYFFSPVYSATDIQAVIEQLQKTYDSIHSTKANFEQIYVSPKFGEEKKMKGEVFFVKPGKMRWNYKNPQGRVLVSDGKTVTLYDPEDQQAMVSQQPEEGSLPGSLSFLVGTGKLKDSFKITLVEEKEKQLILRCQPINPEPNVSEIYLTVEKGEQMMVVASRVIDLLGGENRITFSKIDNRTPIKPETFTFTIPKDAILVSFPEHKKKIK